MKKIMKEIVKNAAVSLVNGAASGATFALGACGAFNYVCEVIEDETNTISKVVDWHSNKT